MLQSLPKFRADFYALEIVMVELMSAVRWFLEVPQWLFLNIGLSNLSNEHEIKPVLKANPSVLR